MIRTRRFAPARIARSLAALVLLAASARPALGASPFTNAKPVSNVLAPGTTHVDLVVSTAAATSCRWSLGQASPYAQMTPFTGGDGGVLHTTTVPLDPAARTTNDVYVRCAAQPESLLALHYRVRPDVDPGFPRIGNLWGFEQWRTNLGMPVQQRARVSLWMGADVGSPQLQPVVAADFAALRTLNPNVLFLASMNAVEPYTDTIPERFYLHDVHDHRIEVWPGSFRLNMTRPEVADFQADWAYQRLASNGFIHDGLFVDNVFLSQSWQTTDIFGNPVQIDADGDHVPDAPAALDSAWRAGVLREIDGIRARMPDIVMVGHALDDTEPRILAAFNGLSIGFEAANVLEREQSFGQVLDHWDLWNSSARVPRLNMEEGSPIDQFAYGYDYEPLLKARPNAVAFARDFQPWMRFALGLSLLRDGWYAYEWGDTWHGNPWWYDEYGVDLGHAHGPAVPVTPGFDPGPNAIVNPGFESAIAAPWGLWADAAGGYAATVSRDAATFHGGAACARIDVTQAPGEAWRVEFRQDARSLVAGTSYTLSFWAKASASRPVTLASQQNQPPWADYGLDRTVSIDPVWRAYSVSFTANTTASDARIQFLLGAAAGTVWIDDVQLVRRAPDVYRRDFDRGVVLVNGTPDSVTIPLEAGLRRFYGSQAPRVQAIVDDSSRAFSVRSGAWTTRVMTSGEWKASGPFYHAFGDTVHWLAAGSGEARWALPAGLADSYTVEVWYPAAPESASWTTSARYDVLVDGAVAASRTLSQATGGDQWQKIATLPLAPGHVNELRLSGTGAMVADAVSLRSASRWNDGQPVAAVNLPGHDAIVLVRANVLGAAPGASPPGLAFAAVAPDPVRARAAFAFELPAAGAVRLRVFDIAGRVVAEPLRGSRPAGPGRADWNLVGRAGRRVSPGVYLAELSFAGRRAVRRFVVAP